MAEDPDGAALGPRERAMVDWALKLTRTPWAMRREDLVPLQKQALDPRAILDLAMIVAYSFPHSMVNATEQLW